jgi:hypothetical protein
LGGGAAGVRTSFGNAATANTGGGGGAGGGSGGGSNGGAGGSGIVIIRYADTFTDAVSTTGSPTKYVGSGYKYYVFNGSGSITF